jgi:hypothetical protein
MPTYGLVSVCGKWQRERHSGPLSPRAIFGVSFLMEGEELETNILLVSPRKCAHCCQALGGECGTNVRRRAKRQKKPRACRGFQG